VLRLGALLMLIAVVVAACERGVSAPTPAVPDRARLVVLSPALAVTLRDLGLEDEIVGRHAYDTVLNRSIPVCGDQAGIDYEALLAARPTDVVVEWGSRDLPARLTELAREHSWRVRPYRTLLTLDEIRGSAEELGRELLPQDRQGDRERLLARLDSAWSGRGDFSTAGRVLILMGTTPVCAVLGPGSFHQQILERIGGVPAVREGTPYIEMDAEDVLRAAPEVIVLVLPRAVGVERSKDWMAWDTRRRRLGPLAGLTIPAVTRERVWIIDDPLALLPGTNLAAFADDLAAGLASLGPLPGDG